MNMHRFFRSVPFCLFATVCQPAKAGAVVFDTIGLDEGNAAALLEATSQRYVDAMQKLLFEKYRGEHRAIRWELLETSLSDAKLARFEYRYIRNGISAVRVYHAMSGDPLSVLAKSLFEGPTPGSTPTSPLSDIDEWDARLATAADTGAEEAVLRDAEDEVYFAGFDAVDVRARVLLLDDSVLTPFSVPGEQGALDAEMKILQTIEQDIVSGTIPAGGSLQGFVSSMACSSCRLGMRSLSAAHGLDIRLSQFYSSLPVAEEEAAVAAGSARLRAGVLVDASSGKPLVANDVLTAARKAQIRQALSPTSMDRSFRGMLWRQRSFRLMPPRLPPVSEAPDARQSYLKNPDIGEPPPPQC